MGRAGPRCGHGLQAVCSAALHAAVIGVLAGAATLPSGREIARPAIEVTLDEPATQSIAEAAPVIPPEPPVVAETAPAAEAAPLPPAPAPSVVVAAPPLPPPPMVRPVEAKKPPEIAATPIKPRPVLVASRAPVAMPAAALAPPAAAAMSDPSPTPGPAEISVDWQRQLIEWLRANQRYPEDARRRNLTGKTQIRFVVERDGAVTDVAILRSSGSELLDNAARALLTGAHLPAFPASMPQDAVPVSLPISFSLNR